MNRFIKKIIFFVLFLLNISLQINGQDESTTTIPESELLPQNTTEAQRCDLIRKQYGRMARRVLFVSIERFPQDMEEMEYHCALGMKLSQGLRVYAKCLKGLGRQTLSILNHGIRRNLRPRCVNLKKRQAMLTELRCATNSTLSGWSHCIRGVDRQLRYFSQQNTMKNFFPNMCCLYLSGKECIRESAKTQEGCAQGANVRRFFVSTMDAVVKDVLDLVCGQFQKIEQCYQKNPDGMVIINDIRANGTDPPEAEETFIIEPMLNLTSKLASDDVIEE
ncbi:uncharacterized protein LOC141849774 [Brevipalpus obovatus]|uniref:uncharacterized protein LOC141849774 n=1 Tax=Brevipalpus obovatus TaxID=246614 RepID=UPI003D9F8AB7